MKRAWWRDREELVAMALDVAITVIGVWILTSLVGLAVYFVTRAS